MKIHYFKSYQRAEIWNYYKLMSDRHPPACEVVNFLNAQPLVELREYDLEDSGNRMDFDAFWQVGIRISVEEYQTAYQLATSQPFELYINGRRQ